MVKLQLRLLRTLSSRTLLHHRPHLPSPRAMSSANSQQQTATNASPAQDQNAQHESSSQKVPLPLPEPGQTGDTTQIPVGGDGVKLDHLGPLVVNENGTMSRIANWAEMAEIERQNTLRILGKRNRLRLDALKAKAQKDEKSEA
ncbi:hypothetical protein F4820DRAFT_245584 [Hypoxylon rubiginosum]|uniref:Uncharacterized protein n=1 Tax=Hypoxylon rubiginosum TaxID=110542 RepID=A0ACB9Z4B0_9PEZI|nr:hypothetical protein F4820DRAFT_245584 [Hypoxylon rubiginosum]